MNATTETRTIKTFVTDSGLAALRREVARLSKVAARKGFQAPEITDVSTSRITRFSLDGHERFVRGQDVTITVPEFRLPGGWTAIGRAVRMAAEDGKVVTVIDPLNNGQAHLTPDVRKACEAGDCQHCNLTRKRNALYVVYSASKGTRVVGSTCMGDFLGVDVASLLYAQDAYLAFARFIEELGREAEEAEGFGGSSGAPSVNLVKFLARVLAHTGKHGYVSGSDAYNYGGTATGREVFGAMRRESESR